MPFDEQRAAIASDRVLGPETAKGHKRRLREGFYERYLSGDHVLDIGYRGGIPNAMPVTEKAIGIELDYPGYDGVRLPFPDNSQDAVFASHCLEHIRDYKAVLRDWFRVIRIGGYIVVAVPNRYLYERRIELPSRFNRDHRRFYSPTSLLNEIDQSLPEGEFRVRSLRDVDEGFDYSVPPDHHASGSYEIETVIEKIAPPPYITEIRAIEANSAATSIARLCLRAMQLGAQERAEYDSVIQSLSQIKMPSYHSLLSQLDSLGAAPINETQMLALREVLRDVGINDEINPANYRARYPDLQDKTDEECTSHWRMHGYFEGREGE